MFTSGARRGAYSVTSARASRALTEALRRRVYDWSKVSQRLAAFVISRAQSAGRQGSGDVQFCPCCRSRITIAFLRCSASLVPLGWARCGRRCRFASSSDASDAVAEMSRARASDPHDGPQRYISRSRAPTDDGRLLIPIPPWLSLLVTIPCSRGTNPGNFRAMVYV